MTGSVASRGRTRLVACSAIVALALALAAHDARAQWSADATVERFSWREHTSPIEVHETGPRFALGVGYDQPKARGALFAYRGRVTAGGVTYNGSFQFDSTKAAHGSSTYFGTTQGGELRYRWPQAIDALLGLDLDLWRRRFSKSQSEDYRIVSVRLGLERVTTTASPIEAGAGMRFLVSTAEDATITDAGVTYSLSLSPGLGANPYLHAGIRITPHVGLFAYWDGMRLGRSNQIVLLRQNGDQAIIDQPSTDLDVVGARVVYGW